MNVPALTLPDATADEVTQGRPNMEWLEHPRRKRKHVENCAVENEKVSEELCENEYKTNFLMIV